MLLRFPDRVAACPALHVQPTHELCLRLPQLIWSLRPRRREPGSTIPPRMPPEGNLPVYQPVYQSVCLRALFTLFKLFKQSSPRGSQFTGERKSACRDVVYLVSRRVLHALERGGAKHRLSAGRIHVLRTAVTTVFLLVAT